MPFFYHVLTLYSVTFVAAILLTIVFSIIFMRNRKRTVFQTLGIFMLMFVISIFTSNFLLFRLQNRIATPYIQDALDTQCDKDAITVDEGTIIYSSRIYWSSELDKTVCYFHGRSDWTCDCDS